MDRAEAFVYDGSDVVLIFDNSGAWQHRYLHGDAVDQVFMQESIGEILWGLADNQGTIRDVANYDPLTDTSAVLNHRQFDSFGNITAESNGSIEFRQAYTGGYFDEDTGLLYRWRRWYDAPTGRWISQDPIRTLSGDTNFNRYVGNSPTNFVDPTGLIADDYSPASFGLFGDGASWLLTHPEQYAAYLRVLMSYYSHQMLIASNGASAYDDGNNGGNIATDAVGWTFEHTTPWDLAHATDAQLWVWSGGAAVTIAVGGLYVIPGAISAAPAAMSEIAATWSAMGATPVLTSAGSGGTVVVLATAQEAAVATTALSGAWVAYMTGHTPGRGHRSKSDPPKLRSFQRKAAELREAAQQRYEEAQRVWEQMSEAARKMRPELDPINFQP